MSAATSTILPGHALVGQGAPYGLGLNNTVQLIRSHTTAGPGRGLCSCGDLSLELPTATRRKAWHRQHKADVAAGLPRNPNTTIAPPA